MPAACFYQDHSQSLALPPLPPLPLLFKTVYTALAVYGAVQFPLHSAVSLWASYRCSKDDDCAESESPGCMKMAVFSSCLNTVDSLLLSVAALRPLKWG